MPLKKIQPKVSVCLALYNGEKFIREQLESILSELCQFDEVIVCDDASSDASCSIVQSINDPRIILLRNTENMGHVKNFEKVLSMAKGDLVFLSDQDDIWIKGKVQKVKTAFEKDNNISLVYHNIKYIDIFGKDLKRKLPKYSDRKKNSLMFLLRQLYKPQIFGCACCLNRKRIADLFPFPALVYAHDHWIAIWAAINGRVFFLSDVLVKYRQHDSNLTPKRHLSLQAILNSRCKLIALICEAIFRRLFTKFHEVESGG